MRSLLLLIVIALAVVVGFSYWNTGALPGSGRAANPAVGTTGTVDVNAARERGAAAGEKVAIAAGKLKESTREAALTSKIKAKMVLDDTIKARAVDVTTEGSTVTVSGLVHSKTEHDRALQLVRETSGVTSVVDHLRVAQQD
jgi:osmotically-inducible protein OsmY